MKIMFSCIILAASIANAAPMIDANGGYHESAPTRWEGNGGVWTVTPEWLAANAGWTYASPERIALEEAAQAEAEAQAAAYTFPAPEVVVPVLDADGVRTGTASILVDASGQIIVVTDTASPQRTAAVQIAEFKAKSASRSAKLAQGKSAAAAANSVPALRAAVATIIEALE